MTATASCAGGNSGGGQAKIAWPLPLERGRRHEAIRDSKPVLGDPQKNNLHVLRGAAVCHWNTHELVAIGGIL